MLRLLASLTAVITFTVGAAAQCISPPGTTVGTGDDTFFTPHYPLGFVMPMAGSANGTYTHFRVSCNGWLILTDGVTTPAGSPSSLSGVSTELAGLTAGYAPRIAAFWRDLTVLNVPLASRVAYDNTTNPGASCKVLWYQASDYGTNGPYKTIEAELYASGIVRFAYTAGCNVNGPAAALTGVSPGNGQVVPAVTDLSAGFASAGVGMVWQSFATGTFDMGGQSLMLIPDGTGGWISTGAANCAYHEAYDVGCYSIPGSAAYEFFANGAVASAALQGNALLISNAGSGYVGTWVPGGAAAYVPPGGGATTLALGDDTVSTIVPTVPLLTPTGLAPSLTIEHNGNIIAAATANHGGDWTPTGVDMANAANRGFYSWHDFNNNEAGSGPIQYEELTVGTDQVLYVTWLGVENFPGAPTLNPSTIQWQVNLTTGTAMVLWVSVDTNITPATGTAYLVGYNGLGTHTDPGSTSLALGFNVPDGTQPLALSASPSPTFPIGGPSVPITYQVNNLRDLSPFVPGFYLATLVFSFNPPIVPGGLDLTLVGIDAPGCNLLVGSLDVLWNISPTSQSHGEVISVPQPLSPGTTFYVQAANFLIPNSLPNGQNGFGLIVSNGVKSYFELN